MEKYPALLDLTNQTLHPLGDADSFLVGRNDSAQLCVTDASCSRQHFRIVRRDGSPHLEPLNAVNLTYRNGQAAMAQEPLIHGDVIQAGKLRFRFLTRDEATAATTTPAPVGAMAFPLGEATILGREPQQAEIHLPHPQVSRVHARITRRNGAAILEDLGSANGTYLNGQRLEAPASLSAGDQIDIGPFALLFTGDALTKEPRLDNVELTARSVTRVVTDRESGQPLTLLDDVSLVVRPREFVCLLGPSGSGKSTLLSILSGRALPDGGEVLINGRNLHAHFEAVKQEIAVVPQKDVLHDSLAVGQALWYTAKLRLPADTSSSEIDAAIGEMLDTVGLGPRRGTLIRHLSGGQAKRASLANEILCKPTLLFLDEVTSGLDEQTDREVMQLFRSLADGGKTVVCITHSLANVERNCHLVVILTSGGKLAFVGTPKEALDYFEIERLGDVYERLAQRPADDWQQAFRGTDYWRRYVADRLPPETSRAKSAPRAVLAPWSDRAAATLRQTLLLTGRYAAIWKGDLLSLLAMAGQALLVAVLLGILFGDLTKLTHEAELARRSVDLLFLLAISSFWFGCNNSAKEIVKERTIFSRERDFNLRIESYYASKLAILALTSGLQTLLLFAVVRGWCQPPGGAVGQLAVLLALAFAGVTLGLAISACSATEEMAITLIPIAVIPQIILAGVIAPLEGVSKGLAAISVSTYWGKRGLDACLPAEVAHALRPTPLEQHSIAMALLVLLLHAAACMAIAIIALRWGGRRSRKT